MKGRGFSLNFSNFYLFLFLLEATGQDQKTAQLEISDAQAYLQ
jgi:hypothetical protein